jgi:hypothetical protein
MSIDPLKARAAQLSFKKAAEGLTPEEEAELARIRQELAMKDRADKQS